MHVKTNLAFCMFHCSRHSTAGGAIPRCSIFQTSRWSSPTDYKVMNSWSKSSTFASTHKAIQWMWLHKMLIQYTLHADTTNVDYFNATCTCNLNMHVHVMQAPQYIQKNKKWIAWPVRLLLTSASSSKCGSSRCCNRYDRTDSDAVADSYSSTTQRTTWWSRTFWCSRAVPEGESGWMEPEKLRINRPSETQLVYSVDSACTTYPNSTLLSVWNSYFLSFVRT